MSSDRTGNTGSSDARSESKPLPDNITEADFLARQATFAQRAMSATTQEIGQCLKAAADPRAWVGEFPWTSMGITAVLGFVAASALTPTREESFKERLRSLMPEMPARDEEEEAEKPRKTKGKEKKKGSALASMAGPLVDAVKTALVSTISSAVTAKVHQPQPNAGNGQNNQPEDPTAAI